MFHQNLLHRCVILSNLVLDQSDGVVVVDGRYVPGMFIRCGDISYCNAIFGGSDGGWSTHGKTQ